MVRDAKGVMRCFSGVCQSDFCEKRRKKLETINKFDDTVGSSFTTVYYTDTRQMYSFLCI